MQVKAGKFEQLAAQVVKALQVGDLESEVVPCLPQHGLEFLAVGDVHRSASHAQSPAVTPALHVHF